MKKRIVFLFSVFILSGYLLKAFNPEKLSEDSVTDPEQQQLQLCFIYSNLLGFNITSIDNPRLYSSISEWLGTPYRYSGVNKKGIDCSGLVCEVYRDCFNKILTGNASSIYKNSEQVKRADLQAGDLVFFKIKKKSISHCGIYIGQNRFVHASLRNGVIVSNLEDPYYKKYFYKGGRINYEQ